jgi:hypothetical protein
MMIHGVDIPIRKAAKLCSRRVVFIIYVEKRSRFAETNEASERVLALP